MSIPNRHVLVVATQCRTEEPLRNLGSAADSLYKVLTDPQLGACRPGLPGRPALIVGNIEVAAIRAAVVQAIAHAADQKATLILALLGHGFQSIGSPNLYLAGHESVAPLAETALDVGGLLASAADRLGVDSVVGIVDTCSAGAAVAHIPEVTQGKSGGRTQLAVLMASAAGQTAYDFALTREIVEIAKTGLPSAGPQLTVMDMGGELKRRLEDQDVIRMLYDGRSTVVDPWLVYNVADIRRSENLGPVGREALRKAFGLIPDLDEAEVEQALKGGLSTARDFLANLPAGPTVEMAKQLVEDLDVAWTALGFIRGKYQAALTRSKMQRAVAEVLPVLEGSPLTDVDFIEHLAVHHPMTRPTCHLTLVRFVAALVHGASLDLQDRELVRWVNELGPDYVLAFNDEVATYRATPSSRCRVAVSLSSFAGGWPDSVEAWIHVDGVFREGATFDTRREQQRAEDALRSAIDLAADYVDDTTALKRIDVAAPPKLFQSWRPEEVRHGVPVGRHRDVVMHWNVRLDPPPELSYINLNAREHLRPRTAADRPQVRWMAPSELADLSRLQQELALIAGGQTIAFTHPPENTEALEVVLRYSPLLVWPSGPQEFPLANRGDLDTWWHALPEELFRQYRRRWDRQDASAFADLRAIWDDLEWISFCQQVQRQRKPRRQQ